MKKSLYFSEMEINKVHYKEINEQKKPLEPQAHNI